MRGRASSNSTSARSCIGASASTRIVWGAPRARDRPVEERPLPEFRSDNNRVISPTVLGLLYALSEVALSVMKRSQPGAASKDTTFKLIWAVMPLSCIALLLIAAWVPAARLPHSDAIYFIGLAVFLLGLVVRFGAVVQLGRFFTVDVNVASDHRVIDTGFYRYVRHPSYAGVVI